MPKPKPDFKHPALILRTGTTDDLLEEIGIQRGLESDTEHGKVDGATTLVYGDNGMEEYQADKITPYKDYPYVGDEVVLFVYRTARIPIITGEAKIVGKASGSINGSDPTWIIQLDKRDTKVLAQGWNLTCITLSANCMKPKYPLPSFEAQLRSSSSFY